MRLARAMLAVLLLVGLVGPAPGLRPAAAASPDPSPSPPTPTSSPAPPAPAPARSDDPLEEFVPRERVPADSVVSFPVDI